MEPLISELDRGCGRPLEQQLYDRLRDGILAGQLPRGARLPGSRSLAVGLGVARNTVLDVFARLIAEGYLTARQGSGTRVVGGPWQRLSFDDGEDTAAGFEEGLSRRGGALAAALTTVPVDAEQPRPFSLGPDAGEFPSRAWARIRARERRAAMGSSGGRTDSSALATEVASWLAMTRGVACRPSQVLLVSSTLSAIDLTVRLLTDPGDRVLVENPGSPTVVSAFRAAGLVPVPVDVDEHGAAIAGDVEHHRGARLAYLTPSQQAPLGVTMSLDRRRRAVAWAARSGAWVIEDDAGSEYLTAGRSLTALQGLAPGARVLYLGSLGGVMFPEMTLSYLVVPASLVGAFTRAQTLRDDAGVGFDHRALATFLSHGHLQRHAARVRNLYHERHQALLSAVREQLGSWLAVQPGSAGTQVVGYLRPGLDDGTVAAAARQEGVIVRRLSEYYCANPRQGLVLGSAAHGPAALMEGVHALRRVLVNLSSDPPGEARSG